MHMAPQAEVTRASLPSEEKLRHMVREVVGDVLAAQQKEQRPAPRKRASRSHWLLLGVPLVLAAAAWTVLGAEIGRPTASVPQELWGVWTAAAPSHAQRPFALSQRAVTFYTGGSDSSRLPIRSIRAGRDARGTQYVLEYVLVGEPYEFSFYHSPERGGVIYFANHREFAWRRAGPAGAGSRPNGAAALPPVKKDRRQGAPSKRAAGGD
jgi:hypothetical protein